MGFPIGNVEETLCRKKPDVTMKRCIAADGRETAGVDRWWKHREW